MAGNSAAFLDNLAQTIAALEQPAFPPLLERLVRTILPYDHMLVLAYYRDRAPEILYARYARPEVESLLPDYLASAYLLDPFYHAHQAGMAEGLYRLRDVAPDHFRRSTYYLTHYRKAGLSDEVTFLNRVGRHGLTVSLLRREQGYGTFSSREVAALRPYEAVIRALIVAHWHRLPELAGAERSQSLAERIVASARTMTGAELTRRQAEIVGLVLRGHSSRAIALKLAISPETVKVHRRNAYAKLGISSQAELFRLLLAVLSR
ncbi:MAG: LuxR C-terminal-related transcriptional regulator [Kiloniellales bacterium]